MTVTVFELRVNAQYRVVHVGVAFFLMGGNAEKAPLWIQHCNFPFYK